MKERAKAAKELDKEKKKRWKEGRPLVNEAKMNIVHESDAAAESESLNAGVLAETVDKLNVRIQLNCCLE